MHVIIPAAGLGTRFLPITKSVPKEMMPILDKPAIHYILEEAKQSGIHHICLVISDDKKALVDYLQPKPILETRLASTGKRHLLNSIDQLLNGTSITYHTQHEPRGMGHALLQAQTCITDEYFCVMLPDDLIFGIEPELGKLIAVSQKYNASVVLLERVPAARISSYGIIKPGPEIKPGLMPILDMIEKPQPQDAPSDLSIVGRYILHRDVLDILTTTPPATSGEIQLPDSLVTLIKRGYPVLGLVVTGNRFDTGTPAGWLAANNYLAAKKT